MLKDRDGSAEGRLLALVRKLSESGSGNSAVINLASGEVSGERGKFVIDEELLSKVKFITEGRLDDSNGAPTLRVVGDVVPMGAPKVTIQKSVMGAFSERHIQDAFLKQVCESDPKIYVQAQSLLQPIWMPVFFFGVQAGLSRDELCKLIAVADSPYKDRISKHEDRIKRGHLPPGLPARGYAKAELTMLESEEPIVVADADAARRVLAAARLATPDTVKLDRILAVIGDLRARFGGLRDFQTDVRYALATIDVRWFSGALKSSAGKDEQIKA